jgi:hypothetical protein
VPGTSLDYNIPLGNFPTSIACSDYLGSAAIVNDMNISQVSVLPIYQNGVIPITPANYAAGTYVQYVGPDGVQHTGTPAGGSSLSLTTTGSSGPATYTGGVLNIPNYAPTVQYPIQRAVASGTFSGLATTSQVNLFQPVTATGVYQACFAFDVTTPGTGTSLSGQIAYTGNGTPEVHNGWGSIAISSVVDSGGSGQPTCSVFEADIAAQIRYAFVATGITVAPTVNWNIVLTQLK